MRCVARQFDAVHILGQRQRFFAPGMLVPAKNSDPRLFQCPVVMQAGKIVWLRVLPKVRSPRLAVVPRCPGDDPGRLGQVAQADQVIAESGSPVEPVNRLPLVVQLTEGARQPPGAARQADVEPHHVLDIPPVAVDQHRVRQSILADIFPGRDLVVGHWLQIVAPGDVPAYSVTPQQALQQ